MARPVTLDRLKEDLRAELGAEPVQAAIDALDQHGLVFRDERFVIGLALPEESYQIPPQEERLWAVA